jgi:hypothetical protein
MTESPDSAPDLKDGSIVSRRKESGRTVRTNVECVLERRMEGKPSEFSYLSNECRTERVGEAIFDGRIYEACMVTSWDGVVCLRHGSFNYGLNPVKNAAGRMFETAYVKSTPDSTVVHCRERPINLLNFEEAESFFYDGPTNNIFMKIDWEMDGVGYSIYTPCRYTNYLYPSLTEERYLQPISGYVTVEIGGQFYLAYVAAYVTQDGTKTVEFICRDKISFIQTKPKTGRFFWLFSLLDRLLLNRVFVTDEFHKIVRVKGQCTFFTYRDD